VKQLLFGIFLISLNNAVIGQTASTVASGRINVVQPLSITSTGGTLNFGDIILTGSTGTFSIEPAQGQQFRIVGNLGRSVSIIFNQITLSNSDWVALTGGTIGSLTFIPKIISSANDPITSGNFYHLIPNGRVAILDILVGGSITISSTQPQGDYSGQFTISVSY
jgi:hypothetical protein